MDITVYAFDDLPAEAIVIEPFMPPGQAWKWRGLMFVPLSARDQLGEPNDSVLIGTNAFEAWS